MRTFDYLPEKIPSKGINFYYLCAVSSLPIKDQRNVKKLVNGKRYRTVKVLSKNLRGRTDLHGNLYKPSFWLFVEQ